MQPCLTPRIRRSPKIKANVRTMQREIDMKLNEIVWDSRKNILALISM